MSVECERKLENREGTQKTLGEHGNKVPEARSQKVHLVEENIKKQIWGFG